MIIKTMRKQWKTKDRLVHECEPTQNSSENPSIETLSYTFNHGKELELARKKEAKKGKRQAKEFKPEE